MACLPARAALLARAVEAMARRPEVEAHVEPLEPAFKERVARLRLEIERDRPAKQCPACAARVLPGDRFCVRCGEALASACPSCGAPMGERDRFCAECGRELAPATRAFWLTRG